MRPGPIPTVVAPAVLSLAALATTLTSLAEPVPEPPRLLPAVVIEALGVNLRAFAQPAAGEQSPSPEPAVYVPDSAKALEQFRLAERLESQREWSKAAEVYQEIVDTLGDRVMPVPPPLSSVPTTPPESPALPRYETVARQVERKLANWPEDGLRAYRLRFEAPAADLLRSGPSDPAKLAQVTSRYFVTPTALLAATRLIDLRLESGDLSGALALCEHVLASHPLAAASAPNAAELSGRAGLLLRGAAAAAWSGDAALAEKRLAELTTSFPAATATIAGESVNLATEAARLTRLALASQTALSIPDWPTPGGDATRSRISSSTAKPVARLTTLEIPALPSPRAVANLNPAQQQRVLEQQSSAARDGAFSVILPSAGRDELFFQDGSRLYAVSLESGVPLPGWAATYPNNNTGVYTIPRPVPPATNHQYSLTLTDTSVLAVMGFSDTAAQQFTATPVAPSAPRLIRLDRATGRVVWEVSPRQFAGENEGLKSLELSGSPVILADAVFVAARGTKGNQFDDAYVLCFDYASGRLRWATYVASSAGALRAFMDGTLGSQTVSHLAAAAGRVVIQTNLGAIASLDAVTGRPEWISLYRRDVVTDRARNQRWNPRLASLSGANRPWAFNPPILSGGLLYALPTDARELVVLDAASGEVVKSVPTAEFDNADVLIHADADRVILAAPSAVYAVEWRKHSTRPLPPNDDGYLLWRSDLAGSPLRGRPFLTSTSLFVPTQARLLQIDPRGGKTLGSTPDFRSAWKPGEGQGNVIAAADHLVIAGPSRVEIYTDLALAESKYKSEIQRNPTLPEPRLRWAEVVFNAGQTDLAISLLDEAAALIPNSPSNPSAAADRLFTSAISMAEAVTRAAGATTPKPPTSPPSPNLAAQTAALYDRAAKVARTPSQQVEWRRRRAEMLAASGDPVPAIELWQQVLSNPAWRAVRFADETTANLTDAARLAKQQIAEIVAKSPGAYGPFNAAADALLAVASDTTQLVAIAQTHPNSNAAPTALLAAAGKFESAADPASAARVLRELFVAYPSFSRRAFVAESMARVYAALPGRSGVALSRLAMGSRLFPNHTLSKPLLSDSGATLVQITPENPPTFAQAAQLLRDNLSARPDLALPEFRLPRDEQTRLHRANHNARINPIRIDDADNIDRVLSIVVPLPSGSRTNLALIQRPQSELSLIHPGKGVLWTAKSPGPLTTGCAFINDTVVAWDEKTLVGYAAAGPTPGQVLWRVETATLPPLEIARGLFEADDPGDPNAQIRVVQNGRRLNVFRPGMPVRVLLPPNLAGIAGMNNRPQFVGEQIASVALAGDRILVSTASGRLACISPDTGRILWQSRPTSAAPQFLVAGEDFAVVISADESGSSVSALDADTGVVTWRRTSADVNRQPLAAALSPDGILLYTLIDRICLKDLFDPGEALTLETPPDNTAPFAGMGGPGQLAISDGLLLAATDRGQFVRAFVIADQCKPLRLPGRTPASESVPAVFPTLARVAAAQVDATVSLHVDGTRLYTLSQRSLVAHDLRTANTLWKQTTESTPNQFESLHPGKDFILATTRSPQNPQTAPNILAVSRDIVPDTGRESGRRLHEFPLPSKTPVKQILPTSGGILFLATDGTLRFARGTAN